MLADIDSSPCVSYHFLLVMFAFYSLISTACARFYGILDEPLIQRRISETLFGYLRLMQRPIQER